MAVDPKWLRQKAAQHQVVTDGRVCDHCGYELQGLPMIADCPECGRSIDPELRKTMSALKPKRSMFVHIDYSRLDIGLLRRFARATTLMWVGALLMMIGMAVGWGMLTLTRMGAYGEDGMSAAKFGSLFATLPLGAAIVWWLGCLLFVFPRTTAGFNDPRTGASVTQDLAPEGLGGLVKLGALAQALMPLSMLLGAMSGFHGGFSGGGWPYVKAAGLTGVAAAVAAMPLMASLKNLATWSNDDEAFNRLGMLIWGLPLGAIWLAILPSFHQELGGGGGLIGMGWSSLLFVSAAYVPWLWIMSLHTLSAACRWAPTNQRQADAKEARFVQRALEIERRTNEERAKWGGELPD